MTDMLSIGAAVGKSPTGPFTDIGTSLSRARALSLVGLLSPGHPLVQNTSVGLTPLPPSVCFFACHSYQDTLTPRTGTRTAPIPVT
jgi:hypothetical protein